MSCRNLGLVYQSGDGVTADAARSRTLFDKACKGGDEKACGELKATENAEGTGKLLSRVGPTITIKLNGPLPPPKATGELSKMSDMVLFKGWLTIAKVTVKDAGANGVVLTMTEERSVATVNGKKVNHFTPGTEIRLTWKP